jgi:hypothetical protein
MSSLESKYILKSTVSLVETPCISWTVLRFGGKYRLHLHGWKVSQAGHQQKQAASWAQLVVFCRFTFWLILGIRRCRRYILPKRRALSKVYGVTTQKIVIIIATPWEPEVQLNFVHFQPKSWYRRSRWEQGLSISEVPCSRCDVPSKMI